MSRLALGEQLRFAAARYALEGLGGGEIFNLARACAADSTNIPLPVCEIVTQSDPYPSRSTLGPLFEQWLAIEDIEIPSVGEAVWEAIRYWLVALVVGDMTPLEGLTGLMAEIYYADRLVKTAHFAGDSHGIEDLVGDYYVHEDLLIPAADVPPHGSSGPGVLREWNETVVENARAWLREHGRNVGT